jgi:tRNA 5-methylaminomethyl-2-thiouridine biosynthesis bifunctional protein
MTGPLRPAHIDWGADGLPRAPDFGDVYHPAHGAFEQAQQVFLAGNGLPERWRGRSRFVILETGFGLGHNFLAAWGAWRADAARPRRLWFVSVEAHPAPLADLRRAHADSPLPELAAALHAGWPPPVAGLHRLEFESGQVVLQLAFGDIAALLPQLRLAADAFFLDGFAPDRNPAMWSAEVFARLSRLAAAGATAATWSVARPVRDGLSQAGFEVARRPGPGSKREICVARYAPRFQPRPPLAEAAPDPAPRRVAVVGAGIAGACLVRELLAEGLEVTLLDRAEAPAAGASGNPAGLIHGVLHADDGPHARWLRAGALQAARDLAPGLHAGSIAGRLQGLLRLAETGPGTGAAALERLGLPPGLVQWWDARAVRERLGDDAPHAAAWFWPQGGSVDAAGWVRAEIETACRQGLHWRPGAAVAALEPLNTDAAPPGARGWRLRGADGHTLAEADAVVLANADGAAPLLVSAGLAPPQAWPLGRTRGQVSWLADPPDPPDRADAPALPVASQSYVTALRGADGRPGLLIGATSDEDATGTDGHPRPDDHRRNLERLATLWPAFAQRLRAAGLDDPGHWQGRVGWRLRTADRLPLAGPLPAFDATRPGPTQLGRVERVVGLHLLAALGSRGLTLAPLVARLVAARLTGAPWPVERGLAEAVDPARFAVRAARRGTAR